MSSVNRVVISGNLGSDPVIRSFSTDGRVAEFSIAVQDRMKKVSWWDIKCYGIKLIESFIEPYIKKGCMVVIDGRLCKDIYEKDGMKQSRVYIVSDEIKLMSSGSSSTRAEDSSADASSNAPARSVNIIEDSVPF